MLLAVYLSCVGFDSVRTSRFLVINKKCIVVPIHAIKALRWNEGVAPLILNLGTRWGELLDSRCVQFTLWKGTTVPIQWEAWWAPASVGSFGEEINLLFLRDSNRGSFSLYSSQCTKYVIPAEVSRTFTKFPEAKSAKVSGIRSRLLPSISPEIYHFPSFSHFRYVGKVAKSDC
jgi:hypothetical protein